MFLCSDAFLFFTRRRISETRQQFVNAIAVDVFRVGDSFTSVLFMEDFPPILRACKNRKIAIFEIFSSGGLTVLRRLVPYGVRNP